MRRKYSVLILLAAVALLMLFFFRNRSPFGKGNVSFASEPKKEITKIEFSQGEDVLILEKSGDKWIMNGEKGTRKSGILFILRLLEEMQIKSTVSHELFREDVVEKNVIPVKVRTFEKRRVLNSFLVYRTQSNLYGNIMLKNGRAKPFMVYVPGFDGDIGSVFTLNELFWQPYTIFNLLPSEIASVEMENFSDTTDSFSIIKDKSNYYLTDGNRSLKDWDSTRVTRYLSYFTMIPFEAWAISLSAEEKKKIESGQPVYRITVTQPAGNSIILTLWDRMTEGADSVVKDSDRLYGRLNTSDELFIVRYFDIDPLLKKREYFLF